MTDETCTITSKLQLISGEKFNVEAILRHLDNEAKEAYGGSERTMVELIARLIRAQQAEIKKLDPDPVVCGCREALCPHTPIAQLPRQALVDHYKARIRDLTQRLAAPESRDG